MSALEAEPLNVFFIISAFIGVFLSFIPFYWHARAANVGTCLFMLWSGLGCLNSAINSIIWSRNIINSAPVWCDISTRFMVALNVGIPSAILVILVRLYKITSLRSPTMSPGERQRDLIIDLSIGLGIPIIQMPLQYVMSASRFDIWENYGCSPAPWPTWLTWLLTFSWPFVISIVASIFGALAYVQLRKHAIQAREFDSSDRQRRSARYQRLLSMTCVVLTFSLIFNTAIIWVNAQLPLQPQISWDFVHADYNDILGIPRVLMTGTQVWALEIQRWASVFCAFVFFAFFGFADEARQQYRKIYTSLSTITVFGSSSSLESTQASPRGMISFSGSLSFINKNKIPATPRDVEYSPTIPSIYSPSITSEDIHQQKRDTFYSFIDSLSVIPADEDKLETSPRPSSRDLSYPPGLGPNDVVRSSPGTTAAPRHSFDGPRSARPYSTWSDAV